MNDEIRKLDSGTHTAGELYIVRPPRSNIRNGKFADTQVERFNRPDVWSGYAKKLVVFAYEDGYPAPADGIYPKPLVYALIDNVDGLAYKLEIESDVVNVFDTSGFGFTASSTWGRHCMA